MRKGSAMDITPHDERTLEDLQARWPELDITREWWGYLCVPRGTHPVIMAIFPDGVDEQLIRIGEEPAPEAGANVVELSGRRASQPADDA
jgi:hypothetical protein